MMRTQVYLPKPLYHRIGELARQDRKPKAQVIRELLEQGVEGRRGQGIGQALQGLVQIGQNLKVHGPSDLSSNIDRYLYDDN